MTEHIGICASILKRLITGDELWIVFNNINRKDRLWCKMSQPRLHQHSSKQILLSVWWNYKRIQPFELVPRNQTINSFVYKLPSLAMQFKKAANIANIKNIVFQHYNAWNDPFASYFLYYFLLLQYFSNFLIWRNISSIDFYSRYSFEFNLKNVLWILFYLSSKIKVKQTFSCQLRYVISSGTNSYLIISLPLKIYTSEIELMYLWILFLRGF